MKNKGKLKSSQGSSFRNSNSNYFSSLIYLNEITNVFNKFLSKLRPFKPRPFKLHPPDDSLPKRCGRSWNSGTCCVVRNQHPWSTSAAWMRLWSGKQELLSSGLRNSVICSLTWYVTVSVFQHSHVVNKQMTRDFEYLEQACVVEQFVWHLEKIILNFKILFTKLNGN